MRDELIARYQERHRHYHTRQHLQECFARFDEIADLAQHPDDVELAIWFHDMATRHVDLWILGAPEQRFDEYEKQVREEYGWVPGPIYRRKRREILESFVARPAIYRTQRFIERYEKQARANLARALARL